MAPEVSAGSKHTPAGQEYLYSLSARLLIESGTMFSLPELVIDSTFDSLGDFNCNSDVSTYSSFNFDGADIGGLFVQDVPNGAFSTADPTLFGLATDNCNAVIPSNFDTTDVDPLDNFPALWTYGFFH